MEIQAQRDKYRALREHALALVSAAAAALLGQCPACSLSLAVPPAW